MLNGVTKLVKGVVIFFVRCWRISNSWWARAVFLALVGGLIYCVVEVADDTVDDVYVNEECTFMQLARCAKRSPEYEGTYCSEVECSYVFPVLIVSVWSISFIVSMVGAAMLRTLWLRSAKFYRVKISYASTGHPPTVVTRLKAPWLLIQQHAEKETGEPVCPFTGEKRPAALTKCFGCGSMVAKSVMSKSDGCLDLPKQRKNTLYYTARWGAIASCGPGCLAFYRAFMAFKARNTVLGTSVVFAILVIVLRFIFDKPSDFTDSACYISFFAACYPLALSITIVSCWINIRIVRDFNAEAIAQGISLGKVSNAGKAGGRIAGASGGAASGDAGGARRGHGPRLSNGATPIATTPGASPASSLLGTSTASLHSVTGFARETSTTSAAEPLLAHDHHYDEEEIPEHDEHVL